MKDLARKVEQVTFFDSLRQHYPAYFAYMDDTAKQLCTDYVDLIWKEISITRDWGIESSIFRQGLPIRLINIPERGLYPISCSFTGIDTLSSTAFSILLALKTAKFVCLRSYAEGVDDISLLMKSHYDSVQHCLSSGSLDLSAKEVATIRLSLL